MASRTDNVMYNLSRGSGGDDKGPRPMELGVVGVKQKQQKSKGKHVHNM